MASADPKSCYPVYYNNEIWSYIAHNLYCLLCPFDLSFIGSVIPY